MNKKKRESYVLNGSYHTLEIKSPADTSVSDVLNCCISTTVNAKGTQAKSIINPNKTTYGDIFEFSTFKSVFNQILNENNITDYKITRADMRFDNYDKNHYLAFAKLNKYLISALMVTYKVQNKYITLDLVNENPLSIAIKNDYFECENYDREYKSKITNNTTEIAKARLEERTKAKQFRKYNESKLCYFQPSYNMSLLKDEFTKGWADRWNKAKNNLKLVQDIYNDALVKEYNEGLYAKPTQFRTLTDFLIKNQNRIFTTRQMVDLLIRLNVNEPEQRAKYHKKKYGIEYFSKSDVEFAIDEILRATQKYFKS